MKTQQPHTHDPQHQYQTVTGKNYCFSYIFMVGGEKSDPSSKKIATAGNKFHLNSVILRAIMTGYV